MDTAWLELLYYTRPQRGSFSQISSLGSGALLTPALDLGIWGVNWEQEPPAFRVSLEMEPPAVIKTTSIVTSDAHTQADC